MHVKDCYICVCIMIVNLVSESNGNVNGFHLYSMQVDQVMYGPTTSLETC